MDASRRSGPFTLPTLLVDPAVVLSRAPILCETASGVQPIGPPIELLESGHLVRSHNMADNDPFLPFAV